MRPEKRTPIQWIAKPPVRFLSNKPGLLAVEDAASGVLHAAFYEPGVLQARGRTLLAAQQPACVMLVPDAGHGVDVYAQDPKAGATTDIGAMTDTLRLLVPAGGALRKVDLDMPGKGCPDDRYRGAVVHKRL
jgi:hypothetical protein